MVHHGQVLVNPSSTTSYGQVVSIDIQYLDVVLDQFFLGQDQATRDEPS
jgi:hypothetical protein